MRPNWTVSNIPDLSSKLAIVTGANIGLGLEIAKRLAQHNAQVIMACRNMQKAAAARDQLLSELGPQAKLTTMQLDVSSFASVRDFAQKFLAQYDRLDILMCNAGVMALQTRQTSADGFEMQFATNHLGHFLLTGLLMRRLAGTEGSRVVTQSSAAGWFGSFDWEDLNAEKTYSRWKQYCMTKLANVTFVNELNRRVTLSGKNRPKAFSVHPGLIVGQLQNVSAGDNVLDKMLYKLMGFVAGTYETGALPALYACTASEAKVGEFYGPNGILRGVLRGNHPAVVAASTVARDAAHMKMLWEVSEEFTGFKYDFSG